MAKSSRSGGSGTLRQRLGKVKVEVVTGAEGSCLDVLRVVNKHVLGRLNGEQTRGLG